MRCFGWINIGLFSPSKSVSRLPVRGVEHRGPAEFLAYSVTRWYQNILLIVSNTRHFSLIKRNDNYVTRLDAVTYWTSTCIEGCLLHWLWKNLHVWFQLCTDNNPKERHVRKQSSADIHCNSNGFRSVEGAFRDQSATIPDHNLNRLVLCTLVRVTLFKSNQVEMELYLTSTPHPKLVFSSVHIGTWVNKLLF